MRKTNMRAVIGVLALGLVLAASAARGQTPTVDEIVAKNLAARGGLDKLRGLQTMKMTGTINVQGMDMPLTVMTKRPNLLFQEMTMQGQRMVSAFDGAKVWAINPMLGPGPRELTGQQADMIRDQASFDGPLVNYKDRGDTLEMAGSADLGGAKAWKLKLTRKIGGRSMFIYVDADTGLEKQWSATVDQSGMTIDVDTVMLDYQPTPEGVLVARSMRTLVGGQQQGLLKVLTVEYNVPIEDAAFQMPAK
jgi:outer membrane lipoprotein-sorting protein